MQIDLNRYRRIILTDLQHKSVGRHTHNSLFITTSAAHYKYILFPDGEFLHDTIKGSAQCITHLPIKSKNMIHIKCALFFMINILGTILLMKKYMMEQIFQ